MLVLLAAVDKEPFQILLIRLAALLKLNIDKGVDALLVIIFSCFIN